MRAFKNVDPFRSFKKNKKLYAVISILVAFVLAGTITVIMQEDTQLKEHYNQQVRGLTAASTGYLVNAYNLYYSSPTIKYDTLLSDFLSENSLLQKFQISDMDGKIVLDSIGYKEGIVSYGDLSKDYLETSQRNEPTYLSQNGEIWTVFSPYIEAWGSHKYTVIFTTSLDQVNNYILQFNIEAILIGILLAIVVVVLVSAFVLMEQNALQKIEKKKMEILDQRRREFLMLASHNLRTPLTQINGYISLLAEGKLTKEQLSLLVPASEAIDKLGEIIDNVLTISTVQDKETEKRVTKENVGILNVISEILEKHTEQVEANVLKVNVNVVPNDLALVANKNYLVKILTAVIVNAIKFNKKNGRVDIHVTSDSQTIHFTVTDTGIGIREKEQRNIYTIFHRGSSADPLVYDYDGVGVGLYMARLLVEYLGGQIWFESVINKGTTFHINLPPSVENK